MDSERQGKLDNACKMSPDVSAESQRLSKLASAFEESLRVSRESDKSEQASRSSADTERPNRPVDAAEKSRDVSVMDRCLAAMTRTDSQPSRELEEQEGLVSRHSANDDDDDDDDDGGCSSLLASLSNLETQLQQEIKQTQIQRLHDRTSSDLKTGVEIASQNSGAGVDQDQDHDDVEQTTLPVNHSSTTTCATTTTTTGRW